MQTSTAYLFTGLKPQNRTTEARLPILKPSTAMTHSPYHALVFIQSKSQPALAMFIYARQPGPAVTSSARQPGPAVTSSARKPGPVLRDVTMAGTF
ncbi:hypothetical protein E2C01_004671 [Portunus trituberculatus]|uniref:Uncharacterized protein n=1 Tax=Portunus trituberculatus TaxID=210409 RepID=A0A5B7CTL7_PORTR|nr:hypothetical protein [Portunus trituberculatus]